ncbi:MAG: DHH family phosphoesterase [Candidatus Gracilibacteria bacterium]|jgi:phosphoesterase RecJ-like protein
MLIDRTKAEEILAAAKKILIAPSSPMDGDSVGSSLALMIALRRMGKDVTVVCTEIMPEYLKFLPYVSQIEPQLAASKDFILSLSTSAAEVEHLKYEVEPDRIKIIVTPKQGRFNDADISVLKEDEKFDLIVTVDTGDLVQLGKLYEEHKELFTGGTPLLNIDHHASNGKFGTYNLLDYSAAATTQIITPMILDLEKTLGEEVIDEDMATLLLVGIITDTGSFQHTNTTPEAFEVAASLLDRGGRQQEIIKHVYKTKSLGTLKLWGRVLSRLQYDPTLKFVYSFVTLSDLKDTNTNPDDTGGIIDELLTSAPGAEVVMMLKEKEEGFISGSFRAPGTLANVDEVAKLLGGGGHKKAAGFRIKNKSMEDALTVSKEAVSTYMSEKLGLKPTAQAAPQAVPGPSAEPTQQQSTVLFPGLTSKPQIRVPAPSQGGEDMLLENFRRQSARAQTGQTTQTEDPLRKKTARFFQDKDGQIKPQDGQTAQPTVGDILSQFGD